MKRRRTVWLALFLSFLAGCGGSWSSGDRVLVTKSLYDIGAMPPRRFDVVVFRCPQENQDRGGPLDNFIKRLLGLAGETLAIFFGQIFITTDLQYPDDLDPNMQQFSPESADRLDLWRSEYMYKDSTRSQELFKFGPEVAAQKWGLPATRKLKGFKVLRKPPEVMLALRRIVDDNDFPAKDLVAANFPPRWASQQGGSWKTGSDHSFHIDSRGNDIDWLHYQHILRPSDWPSGVEGQDQAELIAAAKAYVQQHKANDKEATFRPQLITDFMGYNSYEEGHAKHDTGCNWVGDLMLDFNLKVDRAEGEFWLELARGVDRFRAQWNLADGTCTLWRLQDGKEAPEKPLASTETKIKTPGTYHIRFANFDQRLTLWVDRALPFKDGVEYPQPWRFDQRENKFVNTGPTANDLKPASIGSKNAAVQLLHLQLWRNTYYTTGKGPSTSCDASLTLKPEQTWDSFWSNPDDWSRLRELDFATLYVQKGHYLCLGDNSPHSSDGRTWGAVPERLMLGRALVVYFPFDRAGLIR
jgi:signal peptidase I